MSTTITITLDGGITENVTVAENNIIKTDDKFVLPIKPKSTKRSKKPNLAVSDEESLRRIFDAGLISKMHGVNFINGKQVYFFDVDEGVRAITDEFNVEVAAKESTEAEQTSRR
jgi:hypothetical protein